ncbi:pirin family protein [Skermanella mucosa]|uniref:pirin family protein n=1 Tax=Skermanella mucosa TaxID=1789672 RepID=UPI00192BA9B2|nr:pirin family protein [Skermanella mucosa]UEM18540.1 pirin family protein [Skermanella mucosa]
MDLLETLVVARTGDIGGFAVRRALPSVKRRMVGPFVFLDQMGPAEFVIGHGLDVRPHPHIGLATVTYLFEGEILHRDSLGTIQPIQPGAVNWMTAGRGISHSERTAPELRARGFNLFGIQSWVALPAHAEETDPAFVHHPADDLPLIEGEGKRVRVIAGSLYGAASPVATLTETFYADAALDAGASIPLPADQEERAVYVVQGRIDIAGDRFEPGQLLVFRPGDAITITALEPARLMLLGGAAMDGPRHIWWNFVSSSKDRIEQAKADWKAGRFGAVPDDAEFIPLPER